MRRFLWLWCAVWLSGFSLGVPAGEIAPNTWVRLADCPGDAEGREVPPGRAATWAWVPPLNGFVRYGGYTPRFSNAMDLFEPAGSKWTRLFADDEHYPADRPPGVCEAALAWDEQRKVLWIAGGATTAATGERGVWSYDPATKKFAKAAGLGSPRLKRMAIDVKRGLIVASPQPSCDGDGGVTYVYSISGQKWETLKTPALPQDAYIGNFPICFDQTSGKFVAVGTVKDKLQTWLFDADGKAWEKLDLDGPSPRNVCALACDPGSKQVMLYGGSDGRNGEYVQTSKVNNDTWFLDVAAKKWTEVKTPGPPLLMREHYGKTVADLTYRLALAWNPDKQCMTLSDPDFGVWEFKYVPNAPPGSTAEANGFTAVVGAAAKNKPAEGPKEIRREFPAKELNPRLKNLADNTVTKLQGGFTGAEIAWVYNPDTGLCAKYGGCGNGSSPYWAGYGNDLVFYDPASETTFTRRVGEVSGAARPGNGCTRTIVYDTKRKKHWFFGTTASGPFNPAPKAPGPGFYSYDFEKDLFTLNLSAAKPGDSTQAGTRQTCVLAYDPDHDLTVLPGDKRTLIFNFETASWEAKASPDSPGSMYEYEILVYVNSKKGFLRIASVPTGKTSKEKPPEAKTAEQVAGKELTFWSQNQKTKDWNEHGLRTYLYDPVANKWTDLNAANPPPYRGSKYGLAYDPRNDVVLLVGGAIGWNGPHCKDMWLYDVKANAWTKLDPKLDGAKPNEVFTCSGENLMASYDTRHEVFIFRAGALWAYRYKK